MRDFYDQYINAAAVEFFNKYDPDIFWGDGDWGGDINKRKFRPVISYFLNHAAGRKEVVFNDRLGECRGSSKGDPTRLEGRFPVSPRAISSAVNAVMTPINRWMLIIPGSRTPV